MEVQVNYNMKAKGILFDLDGTLVNSLPAVERCWLKFAQRHHLDATQVLTTIHGRKAIDNIELFLPDQPASLIEQEYHWMEQLESNDVQGIDEIPGASDFLQLLSSMNIPWGIVTSGTKIVAEARFSLLQVTKPAVFITGEMVVNTKPAPDGYLQGAKLLGLAASSCIVFEDSAAGIESANKANCQVIGVNTSNLINHHAQLNIDNFNDLIVEKITGSDQFIINKKTFC